MKIPFFRTTITGDELKYTEQVLGNGDAFANSGFVAKCEQFMVHRHGVEKFFLTKSCTHSLELAAIILDIKPGDEIILPSYAFVSCANAFALRGATCVFVDIHPGSMIVDETKIESAITKKTKAILTLNYASVGCNYAVIKDIAKRHNLYIVEDNAHGIGAQHEGAFLGTFGDISTFSFDHMKNVSCGQGGGISINNPALLEKFYVHYEFGTNRRSFMAGSGDSYEWKNIGSNYPISELNASMLFAQLEKMEAINSRFMQLWNSYYAQLKQLDEKKLITLPAPPQTANNNGHCFFIKVKDDEKKKKLVNYLLENDIQARFHYTPLHSSKFGADNGRFNGEDKYTSAEAHRLLRLPIYFDMKDADLNFVVEVVNRFYSNR
ncbi:MAG: TDP-4-oxo-6-deoxy-D-glucose aminotransferase [Bacteroidota bacterium]|nr:TDP-4-oxo-6-deoxy-D-glucose aminotransferase [Bacteroidota bacterium]